MYIKSRVGWQALTKNEYMTTGDYYLITGTDIDPNHTVDLSRSYYVSKERYEMDTNIQVKNRDIIITKDGTIGKVAMISGLDKPATLNSHLFVLRDESGELDNNFFLQLLCSHIFEKFVESVKTGSTLTGLPQKTIVEFKFLYPSLEEQQKIGAYFSKLDDLITLHQREYFSFDFGSGSAKIAQNTLSWEQRKFSDFAQRESAVEVSSPNCPCVEYEDVIAEEGRLNKDIKLKETQKTGIKFDGTQVLYGKLRPYLHNWLNPDFTGVAVGDWWVLRPICIDKDYLYRLIQTKQFDDVANQSAGSKMPRADWNLISNTEFFVPISMEEQSKIAQAFADLDTLITLHQREPPKEE